jgi:FtsP/CotA-like multicopper oxidase with cupredoxin domain
MMDHPIDLHGMWSERNNGAGANKPRKHTINVKPGERVSFDVTADALGA